MASKKSTANPLDPLGLMKNFDPNTFLDEFNKALSRYSIPGFDTGPLVESQRKNMEALMKSNQALMEGGQKLLQRQVELLTEANREAAAASSTLTSAKPGEVQQKQVELVNAAYGKTIAALQEAAETIQQTQQKALEALENRWREGIEELRALASQGKG